MPKMSLSELKALLESERNDALAAIAASKLSAQRSDAMDYYLADMSKDMPAPEGRSQAVSTDVADTIEGLMPSLMEIFCAGEEVVKFEPAGPDDVAAAEQETDYVNHVFMQANPGFLILYTFIKDALLSKTGIVKVWWEERTVEERETYLDLTDDAFALLAADPDVEIIAHSARPAVAPPDGEDLPIGGPLIHDVICARSKTAAQAKIEPVPPEEFGISRNARSLRDCDYCFHKVLVQQAKLIAEGYNAAQVKTLPTYTALTNIEEVRRDTVNEYQYTGDEANQAARRIETTEHYIRMDYEGDGKARLYKVRTGGAQGDILIKDGEPDIAEMDAIPFAAMTPVIQTHRFFGRSIADLVMDIQRIKTALLRAVLDNAYLANNPRVEVAEQFAGPDTLDDLLVSRPGGIVRTRQPGGLNWQTVPSIAGQTFPVLEYMDAARELRTGVTRQGQGIDANALQNQSATAVNQAFTAAQARIKLIARIFAETGIRDLFALVHEVIRKHGQARQTVQLRRRWVTVDPREWRKREHMTINVGLGTGTRQAQLGALQMIIGAQKEAIGIGMVSKKNLHNSAAELVKLAGFKSADAFFTDPSLPANPQDPAAAPIAPAPDPRLAQQQAQAQIDHARAQQTAALDQQRLQRELVHQQARGSFDMQIAREQADLDARLKMLEADLRAREHHIVLAAKAMELAGRPGPDGQPRAADLDALIAKLAAIQPSGPAPSRGMRVVRDAAGRVSHLEPL
jgi:hypothetical protein